MKQKVNKVYAPLWTTDKRIIILMGGRGAGRSHVASQFALSKLTSDEYFRCAIMRHIKRDIRNSIFKAIRDRVEEQDLEDKLHIKDNTMEFRHGENSIVAHGFRKSSSAHTAKLKSLDNYNVAIIEEAEEISEDDFDQLDDTLRTKKGDIKIILLLNPPSKDHWIINRWFNLLDCGQDGFYTPELKEGRKADTEFIHTTYQDNIANIEETSQTKYERYQDTKPKHYYNMIRGLVTEGARGRVFTDWTPITYEEFDELPHPVFYGLDFGFSNDPTALLGVKTHNNKVYFHEMLYKTGLVNRDPSGSKPSISSHLGRLGISKDAPIYADSSEPKSIEELAMDNWNVLPAEKGQGSVNAGIDMLLGKNIHYTEGSDNLRDEYENYTWKLDRNKEPTNDPIDEYNHLMDAGRYGVYTESSAAEPSITVL